MPARRGPALRGHERWRRLGSALGGSQQDTSHLHAGFALLSREELVLIRLFPSRHIKLCVFF